jgi:hypothetical protein
MYSTYRFLLSESLHNAGCGNFQARRSLLRSKQIGKIERNKRLG